MEKRVTFNNRLLPYALVAPQMLVTAIFFFWPAGQAIYQSAFIPDPFGLRSLFVGFGNFEFLFSDPYYLASFRTTAVFSSLVTGISMGAALWLAVMDQQVNVAFADRLKRRFLDAYGQCYQLDGLDLWLLPTVEQVAALEPHALHPMQFTRNRSSFIVGLARRFLAEPQWEALHGPDDEVVRELCRLNGVGPWTAEYGAMVGLGLVDTLPAADIGLLGAVRRRYDLPKRPTPEQVRQLGRDWSPWRGLITFYLWHQYEMED